MSDLPPDDRPPDDRLVSGAVISTFLYFDVKTRQARMFARDAAERGFVYLDCELTPAIDLTLEGEKKTLSLLSGELTLGPQRELTRSVGQLQRWAGDRYAVSLYLYEHEVPNLLALISGGFEPTALKLEFDIEVEQWVELGDYWDDVRYPSVDIAEYTLTWSRGPKALEHRLVEPTRDVAND
jgi:hypothetical protein